MFLWYPLPTLSQFVSHNRFHQCMNHKKKLRLRYLLPTFGSFSFFQASLWLWSDKVLQKLTKSQKGELWNLFQCYIWIPRKCLQKPHCTVGKGGQKSPYHSQVLALIEKKTFFLIWPSIITCTTPKFFDLPPCPMIRVLSKCDTLTLSYKTFEGKRMLIFRAT